MFGSKTLKAALTGTTALIGVAFIAQAALAAPVLITNGQTGPIAVVNNESLHVTSSGSVTGGPTGLTVTGLTASAPGATLIQNSGTVSGTSIAGLEVKSGGIITAGINNSGAIVGTNIGASGAIGIFLTHGTVGGGIVNNAGGVIASASGDAIQAQLTSHISGGVSNAGTISAGHTAILVGANSTLVGGITNNGLISGDQVGVGVTGNGSSIDSITNNAGHTIQGGSTAIAVTNSASITGGITNAGTITGHGVAGIGGATPVGGDGSAAVGISVNNGTITGLVNNNGGTISGVGGAGGSGTAIGGAGANGTGISVTNHGTISGFINNVGGTISGQGGAGGLGVGLGGGSGAAGIAISVSGTGSITGGLVNDGMISGTGGAGGSGGIGGGDGGQGVGIDVASHGTIAGITNNAGATISGTGGAAGVGIGPALAGAGTGIAVSGAGSDITVGVDNFGSVTGTTYGIRVKSIGDISGGIDNEVTLNVGHTLTTHVGLISGGSTGISLADTGAISGGIVNAGTIKGVAHFGINVAGGSTIAGITNNVTLTDNGNTFIAAGIISGASAGINVTGADSDINGVISNAGTITGGKNGISVGASGDISGGISNVDTWNAGHTVVIATGTIHGSTNAGVFVSGAVSNISGGINNAGSITGHNFGISATNHGSVGAITNQVGGIIANTNAATTHAAIYADNHGAISSITNSGTIGSAGLGKGIWINQNSSSGLITNNAGGLIGGENNGILVDNTSTLTGGIANSGDIGGDIGILVADGSSVNGVGVVNHAHTVSTENGVIEGETAIEVSGASSISTGVHNSGQIIGTDGSGIRVTGVLAPTHSSISDGVTNGAAGIIAGTRDGIQVDNHGQISGGITNAGTIGSYTDDSDVFHSAGDGISISGTIAVGSSVAGGITNLTGGTISGSERGIVVESGGSLAGGITNQSYATISGGTYGIFVTGVGSKVDFITNSGTIAGTDDSTGIRISSNGVVTGALTNNAGGIISGSDEGVDITHTSTLGSLTNHGVINGGAAGVNIYSSSHITGALTNDGTIGSYTDGGDVFHASERGVSLSDSSTIDGALNNNAGGVITGTEQGIHVKNDSDIVGGIVNAGTIAGGTAHSSGTGIFVSGAKISGGITNTGTIAGLDGGPAIFLENLTGATAININGGRIIGDVTDLTPGLGFSQVHVGGDFTTEGSFDVSTFALAGGHTLTISGDDTITARTFTTGGAGNGNTLTFALNSNTQFGNIHVTNGAADLSGATITVQVNNDSTLTNGTQLRIIHGDNNTPADDVVGAPINGTLVADNSYVWNFSVLGGAAASTPTDNTDLFLQAILAHPIVATDANQNVFTVVEGLTGTTNPQLGEILGNVNAAGSQQGVSNILTSTEPTVNGSDVQGSETVSDTTDTFEGTRLASLRTGEDETTGMSAGNMGQGLGAWGQVFGQHTDQGERDNIPGYNANTYGAALGLDTRNISDRAILGVAFSYGHTDANSDNTNSTDTSVDNYQASLYGDYDFDHATYLNGMVGYTWGNVDTTRHNVGLVPNLTARGSYDTQQISAQAEAGRDYAMSGGLTLTPNVVAHWADFDPDSYTETGAGGADLHVNGKTLNEFELGGGVKAGWAFKNSDGSWLKPQLHVGYRYALVDDRIEDTGQFVGGGGAFSVPGPDPSRSTVNLGASLKFLTTRNWTFTANYDFDWKDNYTSNAGFLRAGYKF